MEGSEKNKEVEEIFSHKLWFLENWELEVFIKKRKDYQSFQIWLVWGFKSQHSS